MSGRSLSRTRFTWPTSTGIVVLVALISVMGNTDFHSPPRYDGAGYSVLALSIGSGQGYRSIDHPESPTHTHFPPLYPLTLAAIWAVFGRSAFAAHLFSTFFTLAAVALALRLYRRLIPERWAVIPALAVAVNWTWGRVGGSIQSEPLFLLLTMATLCLIGTRPLSRSRAVCLGVLLGLSILTRHVAVCTAAAVLLELWLRGERRSALVIAGITTLLVSPWIAWVWMSRSGSQLGLFESSRIMNRILDQSLFYLRRIPDQLIGPIVESATVDGRPPLISTVATIAACAFTGVVIWGWVRCLRSRKTRVLSGIAGLTLALLVVWPFTEAGRFLVPLVPLVVIGLVSGLSGNRRRRQQLIASALVLAISVPYAVYSIVGRRAEAQRRTQEDLDAACAWILAHGTKSGTLLTRHPGEVFWQTGRKALAPEGSIEAMIKEYNVAYLLVDDNRFAKAPTSPLGRFAIEQPDRVTLVRDGATKVYEVQESP